MGPAELDDRELGYIDLLCSALFFLLDSCFLLFLSSFFSFFLVPSSSILAHLGSSWLHLGSILAHLGSILAHLGSPKPPPKLLRKKVKTSPSGNSIFGVKADYILVTLFWPQVQLFM